MGRIAEEQWRRVQGLWLWMPFFVVAILLTQFWIDSAVDKTSYRGFLALNLPAHAGIVFANLLGRVFLRSEGSRRIASGVTAILLAWACVTGVWSGIPESRMINCLLLLFVVVFYRVMLDGRQGAFALAAALVLLTLFWGLDAVGAIRPFRLRTADVELPHTVGHVVTTWMWQSTLVFLGWMTANYVSNRFRMADSALATEREARRTLAEAVADAGYGRLTGTTLAQRYELHELLGRGGMGEVYDAVRISDRRLVAVKVLFPHIAQLPQMIERFRREADAVGRLSSAFVPELFEVGIDSEQIHFIVLERLHGQDLATLLRRRGRLEVQELLPIVERIAAALEAAHAQHIVHRDLKPQNVFLLDAGDAPAIRLLDFGIAKLLDGQSASTMTGAAGVIGSPGFIAPEQARGCSADLGPHTDVFALGAIAYRALTGHSAFPSRNAAQAIYESLHHHPAPPSVVLAGLPSQLDHVLALAFAKDVKQRYQSAADFAADFRQASLGQLSCDVIERARLLPGTPDPYRATATMRMGGEPA